MSDQETPAGEASPETPEAPRRLLSCLLPLDDGDRTWPVFARATTDSLELSLAKPGGGDHARVRLSVVHGKLVAEAVGERLAATVLADFTGGPSRPRRERDSGLDPRVVPALWQEAQECGMKADELARGHDKVMRGALARINLHELAHSAHPLHAKVVEATNYAIVQRLADLAAEVERVKR